MDIPPIAALVMVTAIAVYHLMKGRKPLVVAVIILPIVFALGYAYQSTKYGGF